MKGVVQRVGVRDILNQVQVRYSSTWSGSEALPATSQPAAPLPREGTSATTYFSFDDKKGSSIRCKRDGGHLPGRTTKADGDYIIENNIAAGLDFGQGCAHFGV